jgi:signal transduction histidine kinase
VAKLLGAVAIYHRKPFIPSPMHLSLVDLATNLARIAIERDAAEGDRERLGDAFIADASLNRLFGGKEEETVQRLPEALRAVHPEDRSRLRRRWTNRSPPADRTNATTGLSWLMRMLVHILDFARSAGMSFELKLLPADLHQICNNVVDELRMSRPNQTIELDIEGDGDLVCDADRIARVLSNVIGNAIQHGTKGPISVRVRDTEPNAVAVTVHNFGPPIPDDLQATIFEAFRKGGTTQDDESIGLGLFIANEIVRAHHGSISVRSPDRDGTTFTVVLPRKPVQDPAHLDLDIDPPRD